MLRFEAAIDQARSIVYPKFNHTIKTGEDRVEKYKRNETNRIEAREGEEVMNKIYDGIRRKVVRLFFPSSLFSLS